MQQVHVTQRADLILEGSLHSPCVMECGNTGVCFDSSCRGAQQPLTSFHSWICSDRNSYRGFPVGARMEIPGRWEKGKWRGCLNLGPIRQHSMARLGFEVWILSGMGSMPTPTYSNQPAQYLEVCYCPLQMVTSTCSSHAADPQTMVTQTLLLGLTNKN